MTYDPTRKWNIAEAEIVLPTNTGYFLYLKVPTASGVDTTEFVVDESEHIDPLKFPGYILYKWGYIHPPVSGVRQVSMLWGNVKQQSSAVQSDWNQNDPTKPEYIKNKPAISGDNNTDGGFANSTYLPSQLINGGNANG